MLNSGASGVAEGLGDGDLLEEGEEVGIGEGLKLIKLMSCAKILGFQE
jgi:hypothetical protein